MPITSSAKKASRVSLRRLGENQIRKTAYKKALKNARRALSEGSSDATKLLVEAQSNLGKAVKTNLLHKNTASRLLSRLTKTKKNVETVVKKKTKTVTKAVKKSAKK